MEDPGRSSTLYRAREAPYVHEPRDRVDFRQLIDPVGSVGDNECYIASALEKKPQYLVV